MVALIDRAEALRKELDASRAEGRTVGLVPTMGALHDGHASLVRRAAAQNDVAVVTVFVNPLQFGDIADLAGYPRTLDDDLAVAAGAGAAVVFAPSVEEMYPGGTPLTEVRVGGIADILEGASRPGHFRGVATVVSKLFNLAGPCRAYFGEKDFQQLVVVRRLVADLCFPVEVVGCPIVRDPDGLALSSRNVRLSREGRGAAGVLFRALGAGARLVEEGVSDPAPVRAAMARTVDGVMGVTLDYAEVVEPSTLGLVERITGPVRLMSAAVVDGVRLIDNMAVVPGGADA